MMRSLLSSSGFFPLAVPGHCEEEISSLLLYQKALASNSYQSVHVFTVKGQKACSFVT